MVEQKDASSGDAAVDAFRARLLDAAERDAAMLRAALGEHPPGPVPDADTLVAAVMDEFRSYVLALPRLSADRPADAANPIEARRAIEDELLRRFARDLDEARQRALGVTRFVWRSAIDAKVRPSHAARDDRVFSWDEAFDDGPPGHGFGCRCRAEPAIVDGHSLLADVEVAPGLDEHIHDARAQGLARAGLDAGAGALTGAYAVPRLACLGYRRLFGVITPAEEAERARMAAAVEAAVAFVMDLDPEAAREVAEAAVDHFDARHADLLLLDLEFRLGLATEEALLRAYEEVATLDGSVLLRLRLRPREALGALRAATARLDAQSAARGAALRAVIDARFAELSAQGHGPQPHEEAATRDMLIDRVLHGVDPMAGTTTDGITGRAHGSIGAATRITSEADHVAAEAIIRRSQQFREALDRAFGPLVQRNARVRLRLPIEQVFGSDFEPRVEGVGLRDIDDRTQGVVDVDFSSGSVIAEYRLSASGEPMLWTLFPVGR